MFELTVDDEFCAAHAIVIAGVREPTHGHNWRVRVTVAGDRLDDDGLLCDFHLVERLLRTAVDPFRNRSLNESEPFDRLNPTAEHVARHLAERIAADLPAGIAVASGRITEAPGCTANYRPDQR